VFLSPAAKLWLLSRGDFEQTGRAHTATDAHGDDHVLDAAATAFDQGMTDHACTRHAEGVTDSDRTAVDVEAILRNAQLIAAVQNLTGKGFVEFPQADVLHRQVEALQELGHREHRADTHLVGPATGDCRTAIDAERIEATILRFAAAHQQRYG